MKVELFFDRGADRSAYRHRFVEECQKNTISMCYSETGGPRIGATVSLDEEPGYLNIVF